MLMAFWVFKTNYAMLLSSIDKHVDWVRLFPWWSKSEPEDLIFDFLNWWLTCLKKGTLKKRFLALVAFIKHKCDRKEKGKTCTTSWTDNCVKIKRKPPIPVNVWQFKIQAISGKAFLKYSQIIFLRLWSKHMSVVTSYHAMHMEERP